MLLESIERDQDGQTERRSPRDGDAVPQRRRVTLRRWFGGLLLISGIAIFSWTMLILVPREERAKVEAGSLARVFAEQHRNIIDAMQVVLESVSFDPALTGNDVSACAAVLSRVKLDNSGFLNIVKVQPDGEGVCSGVSLDKKADYSKDAFFQETTKGRSFAVSSYRAGTITGIIQITLALPVIDDRSGKLAYVLRGGLDLDWLRKRLRSITLPANTDVTLLDRTGVVLASEPNGSFAIGRPLPGFNSLRNRRGTTDAFELPNGRSLVGFSGFGAASGFGSVLVSIRAPWSPTWLLLGAATLIGVGVALVVFGRRRREWARFARAPWLVGAGGMALMAVSGASLVFLQMQAEREQKLVEHTFRILEVVDAVRKNFFNAEFGQRGYVGGNDASLVKPFLTADHELQGDLTLLRSLVADNPIQVGLAAELSTAVTQRVALLRNAVVNKHGGAAAVVSGPPKDASSSRAVNSIRLLIERMKFEEQALLVERQERFTMAAQRARGFAVWSIVLALAAFAFAGVAGRRVRQERAKTQARIKESNRRLLMAEEIGRVGNFRLSLPDMRSTWSDGLYRIYGVDRETFEPTLDVISAVCHPDDRAGLRKAFIASLKSGLPVEYEQRIVRPDGTERHIVSRGRCERDDAGKIIALFGSAHDITDIRLAERATRASEARYRFLADNSSDVITQLDADFIREYVSPASRTVFGFEPEEMLGRQPSVAIHPDDVERVNDHARRLIAGEMAAEATTTTYRTRRKDGSELWVEARMKIVRESPASPLAILCSLRDVTERQTVETALLESEERYRLLADHSSDLIIMGYPGERKSFVSPSVTTMLGYTSDEALALPTRDMYHHDDLPLVFGTLAGLTSEQPRNVFTARLRRRDGSYVWGEAAVHRIRFAGKTAYVAAIRNVDERHRANAELELAKEAADLARAEAESANRAKTDFLASMSHEIRTPLNAIVGFTDIIATSGRLGRDQQRQIETVRSSGLALLSIVNDILDFAKVEAGAIELESKAFAPQALIDNCVSMLRAAAVAKALDLRVNVDESIPRGLVGDEGRLRQILLNLLNNAVKFTRAGAITVAVRHEGAGPRGERLRFSVSDTGMGIPKEKQHRLFQRFSQVDSSTSSEFGGTGLGLAICKRLIELMDGEIGVFSDEGRGATFWFVVTLPRGVLEPRLVAAGSPRAFGKRGKLLLVEDIVINQELGRLVLEAAGHTVDIADDGEAAVAAVARGGYDLVLMDVQMPGMDGMTATRLIRASAAPACDVPIIAMTANVLPDQVREFTRAGMNGHVGKPFARAELYATVDRFLQESTARQALLDDGKSASPLRFDQQAFDELAQMLGKDRIGSLLDNLVRELAGRFEGEPSTSGERERFKRDAHVLVSAAAMFGFCDFADCCRTLESIDTNSVEAFATPSQRVREAKAAVVEDIERLRDRIDSAPRDACPAEHRA